MSSIARVNMVLIASKGLLPLETMSEIFLECLHEENYSMTNGQLIFQNKVIGKILIGERIVIQTTTSESLVLKATQALRETFSHRSAVAVKNYQSKLEKEKQSLIEIHQDQLELNQFIREIEEKENQLQNAIRRQEMPNCDAIKQELIEEAENQGYEVVDHSKDEIQLQFIKRSY